MDDDVVEGQERRVAVDPRREEEALLGIELSGQDGGQAGIEGVGGEVGEKAETAQIDPQQGDPRAGQGPGGAEQGAVPADGDDQVAGPPHGDGIQGQVSGFGGQGRGQGVEPDREPALAQARGQVLDGLAGLGGLALLGDDADGREGAGPGRGGGFHGADDRRKGSGRKQRRLP